MPLSAEQKAKLQAEAARRGIDPAKLIAAAERAIDADSAGPEARSSAPGDPPKLFQYHLPFVTVREVRQKWLGLTESFPGDSAIASEWAAKHGETGDGNDMPPDTAE